MANLSLQLSRPKMRVLKPQNPDFIPFCQESIRVSFACTFNLISAPCSLPNPSQSLELQESCLCKTWKLRRAVKTRRSCSRKSGAAIGDWSMVKIQLRDACARRVGQLMRGGENLGREWQALILLQRIWSGLRSRPSGYNSCIGQSSLDGSYKSSGIA